jgi:hypothetical protein
MRRTMASFAPRRSRCSLPSCPSAAPLWNPRSRVWAQLGHAPAAWRPALPGPGLHPCGRRAGSFVPIGISTSEIRTRASDPCAGRRASGGSTYLSDGSDPSRRTPSRRGRCRRSEPLRMLRLQERESLRQRLLRTTAGHRVELSGSGTPSSSAVSAPLTPARPRRQSARPVSRRIGPPGNDSSGGAAPARPLAPGRL